MRDSVPSASYSSVCNVLRQWNIPLIPTYRVYRLYDTYTEAGYQNGVEIEKRGGNVCVISASPTVLQL